MWKSTMKGEIMPIRKCLVLALGFALAIAALAPAAAPAKAGTTDRPVKGTMSGTSVGSVLTGTGTADETGVATHLGRFTLHADTKITKITSPTTYELSGTFTIVAANGDRLRGTLTATGTETGPPGAGFGEFTGHTATLDITIIGGSGRFADASGTLTGTEVGTLIYRDEDGIAHARIKHTFTGHISY
jgi:hypothetical protein